MGEHAGETPRQKPGRVGVTWDQAGLPSGLPGPEKQFEGNPAELVVGQTAPTSSRKIPAGREKVRKSGRSRQGRPGSGAGGPR